MCSYDGYFPPGLPDGLARHWMPDEIIEKFGEPGYDRDVSFDAKVLIRFSQFYGVKLMNASKR